MPLLGRRVVDDVPAERGAAGSATAFAALGAAIAFATAVARHERFDDDAGVREAARRSGADADLAEMFSLQAAAYR